LDLLSRLFYPVITRFRTAWRKSMSKCDRILQVNAEFRMLYHEKNERKMNLSGPFGYMALINIVIIYIVIHQMILVSWLYRHKDGYCERDPRADLGYSSNCREINEYFEICCRSPLREIDRLSKRRFDRNTAECWMLGKYHGLVEWFFNPFTSNFG